MRRARCQKKLVMFEVIRGTEWTRQTRSLSMEPYVVARSHRTLPAMLRRLFKNKWEAVKGA